MEPAQQPNYFDYFGLPVAFDLDVAELRRLYLANSKKFHPDYHTLSSEEEQQKALEQSSFNNLAFKTLNDPDLRLLHILELYGLWGRQEGNESMPPDFLMEMMEVNEKIMEMEFDPSEALYQEVKTSISTMEGQIEADFAPVRTQWNAATGAERSLESAKTYFMKKKYLLRVKENLSKFAAAFES